MTTITTEQQAAIAATLDGMTLPVGLGDEHNACSIAAINLALSGKLTDDIPDCMSVVIGNWIIATQDAMPAEVRNSARWKSLLPLAAGTGREYEQERLAVIVLPTLQPLADERGFGLAWSRMTTERIAEAAMEAARAAARAAAAAAAARAAAWAAAMEAARAAARAAAWAAAEAARAAAEAARAAAEWDQFDPCALLERLIVVGEAA